MGAKLHPSPNLYRVHAPSTHSLPVIKCVTGIEGYAEVEISSSHSGIYRLGDLSPLYQRIWNSKKTAADKVTLKGSPRRTFSIVRFILLKELPSLNSPIMFCSFTRLLMTPWDDIFDLYTSKRNGALLSSNCLKKSVDSGCSCVVRRLQESRPLAVTFLTISSARRLKQKVVTAIRMVWLSWILTRDSLNFHQWEKYI